MSIYFKDGAFYLDQFNDSIPDDAVEISHETYDEMFKGQATGKVITTGVDGQPVLQDKPLPSQAELVSVAEQKKNALRAASDAEISWRQDAVDAWMATDEEATALTGWKKYRVLLMRVDASKAPDIEWPPLPD